MSRTTTAAGLIITRSVAHALGIRGERGARPLNCGDSPFDGSKPMRRYPIDAGPAHAVRDVHRVELRAERRHV